MGRDGRPSHLKEACEGSLRRLRLEWIDLYQLHAVDPAVPFEDQVGALRDLRDAGKIRYAGLSNVTLAQLQAARGVLEIASVQNSYNVGDRESESIVEYCQANGIVFIPYFPLDGGDLHAIEGLKPIAALAGATIWQVGLAWLLHRSPTILPIPGTSSLAHLEENVAAAGLHLSDEVYKQLDTLGA